MTNRAHQQHINRIIAPPNRQTNQNQPTSERQSVLQAVTDAVTVTNNNRASLLASTSVDSRQ